MFCSRRLPDTKVGHFGYEGVNLTQYPDLIKLLTFFLDNKSGWLENLDNLSLNLGAFTLFREGFDGL